jgi:hypothetical protein
MLMCGAFIAVVTQQITSLSQFFFFKKELLFKEAPFLPDVKKTTKEIGFRLF